MTEKPDVAALLTKIGIDLKDLLARKSISEAYVVGIRSGGVWLAERLQRDLNPGQPCGELDISFYRDDFTQIGLNPTVKPSSLPFETEDKDIVLVDDVIMSGRTIRAAMNELFDYGRPASITLVALINLNQRELPIQPDIFGAKMSLSKFQRIKLKGPENMHLEITYQD
jgi:pyrimidine operon attenuation protein/uracil phosphoribosyltransferase